MRSAEQLRAEVRRLHGTISTTLAQRSGGTSPNERLNWHSKAELIANLPRYVEGLWRSKRITTTCSQQPRISAKQRVLAQLLQDAEDKLQQITDADGLVAAA